MALQTAFIYKQADWKYSGMAPEVWKQIDGLSHCYIREEEYNVPEERFLLSGQILSLRNTCSLHEFYPTAEAAKEALEAHRLELLKSFMAGFTISPL